MFPCTPGTPGAGGSKRASSATWPAVQNGSIIRALAGRLVFLQKAMGIVIVAENARRGLFKLRGKALEGTIANLLPAGATQPEKLEFLERVNNLLETVRATCERVDFKGSKKGMMVPLMDLVELPEEGWDDYFGSMLKILALANHAETKQYVTLMTRMKGQPREPLLALAKRKHLLPLLEHLRLLTTTLTNRLGWSVSLGDIEAAFALAVENNEFAAIDPQFNIDLPAGAIDFKETVVAQLEKLAV